MKHPPDTWRDYGMPVVVAFTAFSLANFLINRFFLGMGHAIPVYLIGGCLVSFVLLVRAVRRGILTLPDIGMSPAGWKPQNRLLGILVIFSLCGGFYSTLDQYVDYEKNQPGKKLLQEIKETRQRVAKLLDESTALQDAGQKAKVKQLVLAQVDDLKRTLTAAPAKDAHHLTAAVTAARRAIYEELNKEIGPLYAEGTKASDAKAIELSKTRVVVANATDLVERSLRGKTPNFADYAFWFVWLLPASLAELMVFGLIGFCLPEKWLRSRGMHPILATKLAIVFAAVAFGLYHYTHEERWWAYAIIPLVPIMWANLTFFAVTRNFQLTFVLHNSFAAVGFTGEQFKARNQDAFMDPETFLGGGLVLSLVAFAIAYLALNVLEWRLWPGGQRQPAESPEWKQEELARVNQKAVRSQPL